VILVDANLLLYAQIRSFPEHARSKAWLEGKLNGPAKVGIPWNSALAFVRISTHARAFARPWKPKQAWSVIDGWLAVQGVWVPEPGPAHAEIMAELLGTVANESRLVMDAHLAAIAIEHGLQMCSTDGDFARFKNLEWHNPLL
jgi:toxin-antitoxin system PIN domain toxin